MILRRLADQILHLYALQARGEFGQRGRRQPFLDRQRTGAVNKLQPLVFIGKRDGNWRHARILHQAGVEFRQIFRYQADRDIGAEE